MSPCHQALVLPRQPGDRHKEPTAHRLQRVVLTGQSQLAQCDQQLAGDGLAPEPGIHLAAGWRRTLCLSGLARHEEAVAAFTEALRLDPEALELRPAAKAAFEAAQRGEGWP